MHIVLSAVQILHPVAQASQTLVAVFNPYPALHPAAVHPPPTPAQALQLDPHF